MCCSALFFFLFPSFSQEVDRNGRNALCKVFIKFMKYTEMNSLHLLCAKRADGRTPILLIYKCFQTFTWLMGITLVQRRCGCVMALPGWHKRIAKIIILHLRVFNPATVRGRAPRPPSSPQGYHLPADKGIGNVKSESGAAWRGVAFPPGRSSSTHLQPPERRHHIILPFG